MTKTATATLMAHGGKDGKSAEVVTRQALSLIKTPERTTSFRPVPHSELVDLIENRLKRHGMKITQENYAIQNNGLKLYGVMVVKQTDDSFSFSIGIRTSNDKTMAAQLIAGMRITVCDNGLFSGDPITWRKHTGDLKIEDEITEGVSKAVMKFGMLDVRMKELQGVEISDDKAKALVIDAARQGVIAKTLILDVVDTYLDPPHQEFQPRTMWSLHNAFTETFKSLRPNVAMDNAVELGRMFQL